jgi:hypothetical protein
MCKITLVIYVISVIINIIILFELQMRFYPVAVALQ